MTLLDPAHFGARFILFPPQAHYPGLQLSELPRERAHLAYLAAEHAHRRLAIKQVGPVPRDHRFNVGRVRRHRLDRDAVALAHGLDHTVGFLGKTAGIESEDAYAG